MLTWQHIHPGWNPGSPQEEHHLLVHHALVTPRILTKRRLVKHIRNGIPYAERSGSYKVKMIFQVMAKTSIKIEPRNKHGTWKVPSSPVKES
jgi:hypothetical protein